ncbi:hypothetical protein FRC10_011160 [Ceratobasidium sp. 414]|nr:hypothetical protein FRC10_011160 [Ceratobasidium sp. 414]
MRLRDMVSLPSSKRESAERTEFVESSLASSGRLSERMLAWSRSNERGRLFPMRFHGEWQNQQCPVMGWYEQQRGTSTRFRSVEHRRNAQGPFFHEFLLLKLTDGAVCRVERIGDGSRADAIRYFGCTAHDLVQWFTQSDYDQFSAKSPSILIAEVDLCREFDILDVLAVCYSIQNTNPCCAYTLQRYNCYFLCLTVLTVLTRRVASWETMLSSDDWDSSVSSSLDTLSNLSLEDSKRHLVLRLCILLEPDNPQAGRFILDRLRVHLTSQAGALTSYNHLMSSTLWQTAGESALRQTLITLAKPAVPAILEDESDCGTQFRRAFHTSRNDSELAIQSDGVLAKHYFKASSRQFELTMDRTIEIAKKLRRMRGIEDPVPFGKRMLRRLLVPLWAVYFLLVQTSDFVGSSEEGDFDSMLFSHMTAAMRMKFGSFVGPAFVLDTLDTTADWATIFEKALELAAEGRLGAMLTRLLDELTVKGALGPSQISLVMANKLSKNEFTKLLASLVDSGLGQTLHHDTQEPPKTFITIADFQTTYIKARIDAHAERVAFHHLAAAPLVSDDIFSTITEVWKLLPPGFGGTVALA